MRIEYLKDTYGADVVFIENEDGTTSSMAKSTYEAKQAEQSTPSVTNGD